MRRIGRLFERGGEAAPAAAVAAATEDEPSSIGLRVMKARKRHGWSQTRLAAELGRSDRWVRLLESGELPWVRPRRGRLLARPPRPPGPHPARRRARARPRRADARPRRCGARRGHDGRAGGRSGAAAERGPIRPLLREAGLPCTRPASPGAKALRGEALAGPPENAGLHGLAPGPHRRGQCGCGCRRRIHGRRSVADLSPFPPGRRLAGAAPGPPSQGTGHPRPRRPGRSRDRAIAWTNRRDAPSRAPGSGGSATGDGASSRGSHRRAPPGDTPRRSGGTLAAIQRSGGHPQRRGRRLRHRPHRLRGVAHGDPDQRRHEPDPHRRPDGADGHRPHDDHGLHGPHTGSRPALFHHPRPSRPAAR